MTENNWERLKHEMCMQNAMCACYGLKLADNSQPVLNFWWLSRSFYSILQLLLLTSLAIVLHKNSRRIITADYQHVHESFSFATPENKMPSITSNLNISVNFQLLVGFDQLCYNHINNLFLHRRSKTYWLKYVWLKSSTHALQLLHSHFSICSKICQ